MTAFSWQTVYYPSHLEYQAALLPFAVPAWIKGLTIHHTYRPTADQWRGRRTMDVLERFYRMKGWPAGPHLFLAPDGIYAGTPLASPGVHAGKCNSDHIGLEVVGDFDVQPWGIGLKERIYSLVVLLLHWMGADETRVHGHRECLNNKSCPGAAIDMWAARRDVRDRLFDRRFIVSVESARVRRVPSVTSAIVRTVPRDTVLPGHLVRGSMYQGSSAWARVRLASSVTGYIWAGLGHFEPV